jgi:hypothetical protein
MGIDGKGQREGGGGADESERESMEAHERTPLVTGCPRESMRSAGWERRKTIRRMNVGRNDHEFVRGRN